MKYTLMIHGNPLVIAVEKSAAGRISKERPGSGSILQALPRELCPFCHEPDCIRSCSGDFLELNEEGVDRRLGNMFIDAIESTALAHACVGVDVGDAAYVEGLNTALEAMSNNT